MGVESLELTFADVLRDVWGAGFVWWGKIRVLVLSITKSEMPTRQRVV